MPPATGFQFIETAKVGAWLMNTVTTEWDNVSKYHGTLRIPFADSDRIYCSAAVAQNPPPPQRIESMNPPSSFRLETPPPLIVQSRSQLQPVAVPPKLLYVRLQRQSSRRGWMGERVSVRR